MSKYVFIITTVLIYAFSFSGSVNAQSFGDLLKGAKKIEELTKKKNEEEQPASEPAAQQNARGGLPSSSRNAKNEVYYNCDDNSAVQYKGTEVLFESPINLCLPSKSFSEDRDFQLDVRNMTIPTSLTGLTDCVADGANTKEANINGIPYKVSSYIYCNIGDNYAELSVQANKEQFYIDSMKMFICGPKLNIEGSDWDKRIIAKYDIKISNASLDYISDDRELYRKHILGVNDSPVESISIAQYDSRGGREPHPIKSCSVDQEVWAFNVSVDRDNRQFEQAMVDAVTNSQSAGDDF